MFSYGKERTVAKNKSTGESICRLAQEKLIEKTKRERTVEEKTKRNREIQAITHFRQKGGEKKREKRSYLVAVTRTL